MSSATASPANNRWPAQVKYIVGNEACERFSYYGMRGILAGYITGATLQGGLGQTADKSTAIIHMFVSANYFMPLLGAWLSDKLIGRYHTILWVSLFYCAGHGVLACSDFFPGVDAKMWCLFAGLALIAFGSGGIKPCVSAFMGDQFRPDQSHLLQKAYGAFYWSINLGSFFSFLVIPWIKNHHGYSWAFGVPGIFMGIATLIFWLGTKHYHRVPPSRETKSAGFFKVFWHALTAKRQPGQGFWDAARMRFSEREVDAARSVLPILGIFALVPPFWSLFDQTNSTWVLQGGKMIPINFRKIESIASLQQWTTVSLTVGLILFAFLLFLILKKRSPSLTNLSRVGLSVAALIGCGFVALFLLMLPSLEVGAEQMQSANPALVMILVPLLTLLVYPRLGKLASPLRRMSYGMFLAAASYVIVALLQQRLEAGTQLSVAWQLLPYLVLTAAEVLVSTTGLEFAFREAAAEMKSLIMSFWLLTVTAGNLLVTFITKVFATEGGDASITSGRFLIYAGLTFVVAIIFSAVATFYKYRDAAAAEGR